MQASVYGLTSFQNGFIHLGNTLNLIYMDERGAGQVISLIYFVKYLKISKSFDLG